MKFFPSYRRLNGSFALRRGNGETSYRRAEASLRPKTGAAGSRWGYFAAGVVSAGWVMMLTLVMPACFTASMSVAKAPKGTFSSARR